MFAGHGLREVGFYGQLPAPRSAGSISHLSHARGSHPLLKYQIQVSLHPKGLRGWIWGSVQVGSSQLYPALMAGGDWIPHLVLPHPPHSSASSQAVSHFPLVFIPAFPLVRPKADQPHTIPTETGIRKPRRAIKPNKGLPTTPNHILPRFSLQVPPQAPAAAQGRLSPGFAFLGNHGAPVSCKPLLPQLRIIPPAAV